MKSSEAGLLADNIYKCTLKTQQNTTKQQACLSLTLLRAIAAMPYNV